MKRLLPKSERELYYYDEKGTKILGVPEEVYGDTTGLYGDATHIWGKVSHIRGDVTGLYGDVTGIEGDVTGIRGCVTGIEGNFTGIRGTVTGIEGNFYECNIKPSDREKGIEIVDLIKLDHAETCPSELFRSWMVEEELFKKRINKEKKHEKKG